MKKQKNLLFTIIAFSAILMMTSCGKDGSTGPTGATGANGSNGADGQNGNANVKVVYANLSGPNWYNETINNHWYAEFDNPIFTQNVRDSAMVQAFELGTYSVALPYTINTTTESFFWGTGVGYIFFDVRDNAGGQPANPGTKSFKVIVATPSARLANPNLNWKDYKAVKAAFNLTD